MASRAARAAARAARGARVSRCSSGAGRATRSTTRTSRCWPRSAAGGRRWRCVLPPLLALLALTCALAALARPEVRMSVASEQASIALTIDVSGSMSADDVKPTRLGAAQEAVRRFLDRAARQVPRRPRHLLVRAVRRRAADARPQARARGPAARRHELRPGHRDRRRAGPLGRDPRARDGRGRGRSRRRHGAAPAAGPGPAAVGDPAALGRRADARRAGSAAGCCAREVVRHPGLHRRARHAGRRAQPRRVLAGPCRPTP